MPRPEKTILVIEIALCSKMHENQRLQQHYDHPVLKTPQQL